MTNTNVIPDETRERLFREGTFLVSKIDTNTIESIEKWILNNRRTAQQQSEFTLVINSSGGSPGLVLYFASFLRTLSADVRLKGVAFGECGSAALALLQCCHERVAVKNCGFFIHNINNTTKFSCQDVDWSKLKNHADNSKKLEAELVRLQAKRCGMPVKKWRSLARKGEENPGTAIFTGEAKKIGLIDSVVEAYPLF
jgi:ATP-dependent protease ClpP protease subunit